MGPLYYGHVGRRGAVSYRGLVDFADPQVDPQTGTFSVRAEMPNPDHILLPGQFTKVKLLLDVLERAVVVPKKALIIEKGGAYVFVVRRDSIVEKRFVETVRKRAITSSSNEDLPRMKISSSKAITS